MSLFYFKKSDGFPGSYSDLQEPFHALVLSLSI